MRARNAQAREVMMYGFWLDLWHKKMAHSEMCFAKACEFESRGEREKAQQVFGWAIRAENEAREIKKNHCIS
jgi:hypothetical protein